MPWPNVKVRGKEPAAPPCPCCSQPMVVAEIDNLGRGAPTVIWKCRCPECPLGPRDLTVA